MDANVQTLPALLGDLVGACFEEAGHARDLGRVVPSGRPDLGQFQCNGAIAGARRAGSQPRVLAEQIAAALREKGAGVVSGVSIAGPGFINLTLDDAFLGRWVDGLRRDPGVGCKGLEPAGTIVVDFGGANVAKPLHVGHLRSAGIGEVLKRIARALGHRVIGDVHLGDWGLQMGMVLHEIACRQPSLPYFDASRTAGYPATSPVTVEDLQDLYPVASEKSKHDADYMEAARRATAELQAGRPGYVALWRHVVRVSVDKLREDYGRLGVEFDLWLGESDAHAGTEALVDDAVARGLARHEEGAIVVDVVEPADTAPVPRVVLRSSTGAVVYATTDIVTLQHRMRDFNPNTVLYVVDTRQSLHFTQVFRASRRLGVVPESVGLEHINFGTMLGPDRKPFKTRAGGVMRLDELLALLTVEAHDRLAEVEDPPTGAEAEEIIRCVALATLHFANLADNRGNDVVFDVKRFSASTGRTGPYLLYTAVRGRSILRKAAAIGAEPGELLPPHTDDLRKLYLALGMVSDAVQAAWQQREPHFLCDYAYNLATLFNQFYRDVHVLREADPDRRASYLALTAAAADTLTFALNLLAIPVPSRM